MSLVRGTKRVREDEGTGKQPFSSGTFFCKRKASIEDSSDDDDVLVDDDDVLGDEEPGQMKNEGKGNEEARDDDISFSNFVKLLGEDLCTKLMIQKPLQNPEKYSYANVFKLLGSFLVSKSLPVHLWELLLRPKVSDRYISRISHPEMTKFVSFMFDKEVPHLMNTGDGKKHKYFKLSIKRQITNDLLKHSPYIAFFIKNLYEILYVGGPKVDSLFRSNFFVDAKAKFEDVNPGLWNRRLHPCDWLLNKAQIAAPIRIIDVVKTGIDDEVSNTLNLCEPYKAYLKEYEVAAQELSEMERALKLKKEEQAIAKEAMKFEELNIRAKISNKLAVSRVRKSIGSNSKFSNSIMDLQSRHVADFFGEPDINMAKKHLLSLLSIWKSFQEQKGNPVKIIE